MKPAGKGQRLRLRPRHHHEGDADGDEYPGAEKVNYARSSGLPLRTVAEEIVTGRSSACMTKQPRSALRTSRATRSGGSGESSSSTVSAPSISPWTVSFSTEPVTR